MMREFTAKCQTITDEIITVDLVEDGLAKLNDIYEELEKLNAPVPEHTKIETLIRIMQRVPSLTSVVSIASDLEDSKALEASMIELARLKHQMAPADVHYTQSVVPPTQEDLVKKLAAMQIELDNFRNERDQQIRNERDQQKPLRVWNCFYCNEKHSDRASLRRHVSICKATPICENCNGKHLTQYHESIARIAESRRPRETAGSETHPAASLEPVANDCVQYDLPSDAFSVGVDQIATSHALHMGPPITRLASNFSTIRCRRHRPTPTTSSTTSTSSHRNLLLDPIPSTRPAG